MSPRCPCRVISRVPPAVRPVILEPSQGEDGGGARNSSAAAPSTDGSRRSSVILRAWRRPAIGLRRLASQRVARRPLRATPPTSCAGSARCRRRTTASRCGRSARGCGAGTVARRRARDRRARRSCAPGSCAARSTSRRPRTCAGCSRSCAPRLPSPRSGAARRSGSTAADIDRSARAAARRARRRPAAQPARGHGAARGARASRPAAATGTTSSSRLAQDGLICIGPMQGKQQTFVLLDDWAPPAQARELSREESLADARGALRGQPRAGDRARSRALGGHHRSATRARACGRAGGLATRDLDGTELLARGRRADDGRRRAAAQARVPAGRLRRVHARLQGSRRHARRREHADKIVPGRQRRVPADDRGGRADRRHLVAHASAARPLTIDAPAVRARRPRARGAGAARRRALSRFPRPAGVLHAGRGCEPGGVAVRTAVVLFTRDLRVHDQPALAGRGRGVPIASCRCSCSTARCSRASARPTASPSCSTRSRDLDASLRARGGALVVREGDVVEEAMRVAARGAAPTRSS